MISVEEEAEGERGGVIKRGGGWIRWRIAMEWLPINRCIKGLDCV